MKRTRKLRELEPLPGIQDLPPGRVTAGAEAPDTDPEPGTEVAGLSRLKMHVDNPGQTPM